MNAYEYQVNKSAVENSKKAIPKITAMIPGLYSGLIMNKRHKDV